MNRKTAVIIFFLGVTILLLISGIVIFALLTAGFTSPYRSIGLIRIEGVITSGKRSPGFFVSGEAGAESIVEQLESFRKDRAVRSLVIRINSPGGSAAGSQEIYREIMRLRREGKKITVSMGDVAASGGYYIASAANRIIANPATLTGSIGVITEAVDIHELLDKYGIDFTTIKSGKHKDMGSFSRPITPEERAILQSVVNDVFDQFVSDVCAGRNLPKSHVLKLADGRIYTGRQALKLKLIDRLGSLEDALRAAADDAGIKGEFRVIEYGKPRGLMDLILEQVGTGFRDRVQTSNPLMELAGKFMRLGQRIRL
jgi:protease-4